MPYIAQTKGARPTRCSLSYNRMLGQKNKKVSKVEKLKAVKIVMQTNKLY